MSDRFISSLSSVGPVKWVPLGSVWVVALALWDMDHDCFASFTYEGAVEACKAFGARLPTYEEIDQINAACHVRLTPVTLPSQDMLSPGMTVSQIDALRNSAMSTLPWMKIHADRVREQLTQHYLQLDTDRLVMNDGKFWQYGAPEGRAYLKGWALGAPPANHYIQQGATSGPGPHGAKDHNDYGTTVKPVRTTDPALDAQPVAA